MNHLKHLCFSSFLVFPVFYFGLFPFSKNTDSSTEKYDLYLANNFEEYCATASLQNELSATSPALQQLTTHQEKAYQNYIIKGENLSENPPTFTLPVVVHLIHNNGEENITDEQVETAIEHLNDGFAHFGYYDSNAGVNTQIEFCLAQQTPEESPTTGINRVESELTEMVLETQDLNLKDLIRWNPLQYINIWVVREIESISAGSGVTGYALYPSAHGNDRDGIVVEADLLGSSPANSTVLIHEMGHYLGLYHTFEGGCFNDDCLANGDRVCDTPPDQSTAAINCNDFANTCDTDANSGFSADENDLFWNFMDYGDADCISAFTQGQADRMAYFIDNVRSSLLQSLACLPPCPTPVSVSFAADEIQAFPGTTINFSNNSVGGNSWAWSIGGNAPFSTDFNTSFTFNELGDYQVYLTANPGNPFCERTDSIEIKINFCGTNAHVSNTLGNDTPDCGAPDNMCATIQYTLDSIACENDTVFIHSGTYSLANTVNPITPLVRLPQGTSITLFGVWDDGPVVLDGQNQRRIIEYHYSGFDCVDAGDNDQINETVVFNFTNLRLQNALWKSIDCNNANIAWGAAVHLFNNILSEMYASFTNCQFLENTLLYQSSPEQIIFHGGGAAIYIASNDIPTLETYAFLTIDSCLFYKNLINHSARGGRGGAIHASRIRNVNIRKSIFCSNEINKGEGAALYFVDPFASEDRLYHLQDSYFVNNWVNGTFGSGGIAEQSQTEFILENCYFHNNHFYNANADTFGIRHFTNSLGWTFQNTTVEDDFNFHLNDTTVCQGDTIMIGRPVPHASYLWNTGDTTALIPVAQTGEFAVTVTIGECNTSGEMTVTACEECDDGIDNDGDGLVDCEDPDLAATCCCQTPPIVDLGEDINLCESGVFVLDAGSTFESYLWQDGFSDTPTFTVFENGIYWVTVQDNCGRTSSDTIQVNALPAQPIDLRSDTIVCKDVELTLSVDGFEAYQWNPKAIFDCDTCATVNLMPTETQWLRLQTRDDKGCFSYDSILVKVVPESGIYEEFFTICEGDTIDIFGEKITEAGLYQQLVVNADCTFEHLIEIERLDSTLIRQTVYLCPGDSVVLYGNQETTTGVYWHNGRNENGCDSVHLTNLIVLDGYLLLPKDTTLDLGESMKIATHTDLTNPVYEWTPSAGLSCSDCPAPIASPVSTTTYQLVISNDLGCVVAKTINIAVRPQREIYAANVFTPNHDGLHDWFHLQAGKSVDFVEEFKIFNRWGGLVFEHYQFSPNVPSTGWNGLFNGKAVNAGVFLWYAKVRFLDGETAVVRGDVLLLR